MAMQLMTRDDLVVISRRQVAAPSAHYAQLQALGVPFYWLANALATVCDSVQCSRPGLYANAGGAIVQFAPYLVDYYGYQY